MFRLSKRRRKVTTANVSQYFIVLFLFRKLSCILAITTNTKASVNSTVAAVAANEAVLIPVKTTELQKNFSAIEVPTTKAVNATTVQKPMIPPQIISAESSQQKTVNKTTAAVTQTTTVLAKKPEVAKPEDTKTDEKEEAAKEIETNPDVPSKDDTLIGNEEILENVFDQSETPVAADKDPNAKNENGQYEGDDDDDESYPDDNTDTMQKNNNKNPEIKLTEDEPAKGPLPVEEDVSHTKIESVAFESDPDSNFFAYICALMFLCVVCYILHQNRQKILALVLEGRRGGRRSRERSRGGSKAAYSKLDCNLEEAIMSNKSLNGKSMDVIY